MADLSLEDLAAQATSRKLFLAKLSGFSDHKAIGLQSYSPSQHARKETSAVIYRFLGRDRTALDCKSSTLIATTLDVQPEEFTCPDGSAIYSLLVPSDAIVPFVKLTWGSLEPGSELSCRCQQQSVQTKESVHAKEGTLTTADGKRVRYRYWQMPFAYVGDCTFHDQTFTIYEDGRWTDILRLRDDGAFVGDRHYMTHNLKTSEHGPTLVSISWDHYLGPGSSRSVNESGREDTIQEHYDSLNWKSYTIGCKAET